MMALLALVGALFVLRLAYLQIVRHGALAAQANNEHSRKYEVPARRGEIYVYDGDQRAPIALNQTLKVVYADPRYVDDKHKTAQKLASALGGDAAKYEDMMDHAKEYVELATRVPVNTATKVKSLHLKGIGLLDRDYRIYPEGSLAAQVLGFVNSDGAGQYGVESFLNKQLSGSPGKLNGKTDTLGVPIYTAGNIQTAPKDGTSYQLTIDRNVQAEVQKELENGVHNAKAVSGSAVVMDPYTGAVVAMANYPSYDPNNYSKVKDYSVFSNSVVSSMFEPGSTLKVFTMAAGLDQNKITPDSTYNDTGSFRVNSFTIHNAASDPANGYGVTSMTRALELSLNTGVIYVLRTLGTDINKITPAGKQTLYNYFVGRFGLGTRTGIEQSGEAAGLVYAPNKAQDINYANLTFGQGVDVTMIQMVTAMSAIANGGSLIQPRVVAGSIKPDGSLAKVNPVVVRQHVISPKAVGELDSMLTETVNHGTAYIAHFQNPGYKIGGKTGTAQIPDFVHGGYIQGKNIGDFLGFAPVDHPKFVMMIRINEPGGGGYAETTTVPIFSTISKWLFTYYAIPPTQ
jgi:cell division protein FtsI/penicillin-binding protein 2